MPAERARPDWRPASRSWPTRRRPALPPPRDPRDYGPCSARVAALIGRIAHLAPTDLADLEAAGPTPVDVARWWADLPAPARRGLGAVHAERAAGDAARELWRRRRALGLPCPDRSARARWRTESGEGHAAARAAGCAAAAIAVVEATDPELADRLSAAWAGAVGMPPDDLVA